MTSTHSTSAEPATPARLTGADHPVARGSGRTGRPVRHFWRHLLEMTLAMVAGMLLLEPLWAATLTALGAGDALPRVDVRALGMTATMVAGMALWMWVRGHRWRPIAEMSAAMSAPFLLLVVLFWLGGLPGEAVLHSGHMLMLPAMLVAMLLRRDEYVRHRPLAVPGQAGPAWWAAAWRRWPSGLALLLAIGLWLTPVKPDPWLLLALPLAYLLIGALRRQLRGPGIRAVQLAGLVAYAALLLVVLSVDATLAGWLVAAGWLAHAGWDLVHLRLDRVVPRAYAELCAVIDVAVAAMVIAMLLR